MRSSNPYFSSLTEERKREARSGQGEYVFGQGQDTQQFGQRGASMAGAQQFGQQTMQRAQGTTAERGMTIDDVIVKTSITLGVIIVGAVINYMLSLSNPQVSSLLTMVGAIGGLIMVMVSTFGKKFGSPVVTLLYAAFEGLFVGGLTSVFANVMVSGANAGTIIGQAVLGTIGVFIGMLIVYRTGAIRVTPKFNRIMLGALVGVLVLALGNMLLAVFTGHNPLTDGGPLAIGFSLLCIGLAALSFLQDFDTADQLVRAGAPSKMAWGVALGLAVTLVWLYTEILRLLSYANRN
ncbi:Bax inhibitor-1/YccA family protein [uncultured Corynebacterium sp.]|uniref:Bax inhibitor-1/YccA family protein n=1 Tax=uncultured Corynebacterium sp. TaxID=159447 RepID=UPI0025F0922F|nr:Bax inhibitor-1/YccA family protein [uncultured Corynebacterium sp.]